MKDVALKLLAIFSPGRWRDGTLFINTFLKRSPGIPVAILKPIHAVTTQHRVQYDSVGLDKSSGNIAASGDLKLGPATWCNTYHCTSPGWLMPCLNT